MPRSLDRTGSAYALACLALLVACSPDDGPPSPTSPDESSAQSNRQFRSHDEVLESLAEDIDGFGGLYPDSTGAIVVHLTDPSRGRSAEAAIRARLRQAGEAGAKEFAAMGQAPIRFEKGRYGFRDLATWRRALYEDGIVDGTIMSGIDKRTNRLVIGVASSDARAKWERRVLAAGVDRNAVRYEIMEQPVPRAGLRDRIRPTVGGLQISIVKSTGTTQCTLGANVLYAPQPNNRYFITASHCSNSMWATDVYPTQWHQPVVGNLIANGEALDPAPFSGGACPAGRVCRYGDVTLVRYSDASAWGLGRVALAGGAPSFTISAFRDYAPQPFVIFEFPFMRKTGRTTGTTASAAGITYCLDFHPSQLAYASRNITIGPNWTMLCQNWSSNWSSAGGDSGSPVYGHLLAMGPSQVFFDGIFHAGTTTTLIYSPIAYVASNDFGGITNLRVCQTSIFC